MALTPKQERFAQCVANGKTQADAYREAFSCLKSKPETIIQSASRLMADRNISARVDRLKENLVSKALWTRQDSVKALLEVVTDAEVRHSDKTAAIKVLNEMHGFNAPTESKVETTVRIIE